MNRQRLIQVHYCQLHRNIQIWSLTTVATVPSVVSICVNDPLERFNDTTIVRAYADYLIIACSDYEIMTSTQKLRYKVGMVVK